MSNENKTILGFIELPAEEFLAKTGAFFNPATGAVWELFMREGKLVVDVPHFSFQISPLSTTRFRPANLQINVELEFEKEHSRNSLLLHVYAKGIRRSTFEALV